MNTKVMLTAVGLALSAIGSPPASAQNASQFVPYYTFVDQVKSVASSAYVGQPGNAVKDAAEFEKMRQHILTMYGNAHVNRSFVLEGHPWDCIPIEEQPSARLLGPAVAKCPATPPPFTPTTPPFSPAIHSASQIRPNEKVDALGHPTECIAGEIPMRRITLEDLSHFSTLEDSFQKEAASDGAHKHAYSRQLVTNYGASNTLNIWSPSVTTKSGQKFSLSQQWIIRQGQTVESGWINNPSYPYLHTDTGQSVLFIYYTNNNYAKGSGCYDMQCPGWCQKGTVYLGKGFEGYSTIGGDQWEFSLTWNLYQGNWWMAYGQNWVGYYPGSIYKGGPILKYSADIEFGGETDGTTSWGPMGSGQPPTGNFNTDFGSVAFQGIFFTTIL